MSGFNNEPNFNFFLYLARIEPEVKSIAIPTWTEEEWPLHVEFDDNELTRDLLELRNSMLNQ